MFEARADDGGAVVAIAANRPRAGKRRLEITVDHDVCADFRNASRHELDIIEVNVPRRLEVDVKYRAGQGAAGHDVLPLRRRWRPGRVRGRPIRGTVVVLQRIDEL